MASMQIYSSFDYGDEPGLRSFFLENGLRHQLYATVFATQIGKVTPMFDVYDTMMVDAVVHMMQNKDGKQTMPQSLKNWLLNHASLHDAEIKILTQQQDFDLYDVDFSSPEEFYEWLSIHSSIHDYVDQALGV
jgi:hypothetical protein